jgi:hypothetical protein
MEEFPFYPVVMVITEKTIHFVDDARKRKNNFQTILVRM